MIRFLPTRSSNPVIRLGLLCACLLGLAAGCGNKGPLFVEPDSETLKELERVEQEINQATVPATGTDPDDPDGKKKNNNGQ